MNGLLLLDKPVGLSSNAALQRVRRLAGGIKAGHCGSLDPLASGMLPICLGAATRLAGQLLEGAKAYRFTLQLGERTDTGDAEGQVIERASVPALTPGAIRGALHGFLGAQQQVPPMYSALKRDGEPLYRLARRGVTVPREARSIHIERLELLAASADWLELWVLCSKGTYVRVLGEELARALGSCGRLSSLRRDYVEPFAGEPLASLEQLAGSAPERWPLLPADRAVSHLEALSLTAAAARALLQGRPLEWQRALAAAAPPRAGLWRLYDPHGRFLGLGSSDASGRVTAQRLFPQGVA